MRDFFNDIRRIFNPETAEDRMAIVPLVGCFLPVVIGVVLLLVVLL